MRKPSNSIWPKFLNLQTNSNPIFSTTQYTIVIKIIIFTNPNEKNFFISLAKHLHTNFFLSKKQTFFIIKKLVKLDEIFFAGFSPYYARDTVFRNKYCLCADSLHLIDKKIAELNRIIDDTSITESPTENETKNNPEIKENQPLTK